MPIATSAPRRHPDVVYTTLPNGEIVLLHLDTKQYFSLNETASRVWELLSGEHTLAEIGEKIEGSYAVSRAEAQESVTGFVQELAAENLVIVPEPGPTLRSGA